MVYDLIDSEYMFIAAWTLVHPALEGQEGEWVAVQGFYYSR